MGHRQSRRSGGHQRVVRDPRVLEDAEALVAELTSVDAIHVEKGGVRGEAGPDGRMGVVLGPLQDPYQALPVWLVLQVRRLRLCSGHDEAVEMAVPQIIDAGIGAPHMASARIRSRHIRQRVERQADHHAVGRRIEEGEKLPFGRLQRRIGHVVDEADIDAIRVGFTELDRRFPAQAFRSRHRHQAERWLMVFGHRPAPWELEPPAQHATHRHHRGEVTHISCRAPK